MALSTLNATLWDGNPHIDERIENGELTGIVETREREVEIPKPKGGVACYIEASYIIPKFGKEEKAKLERALKKIEKRDKIKIKYAVHDVVANEFNKIGLNKMILIPLARTREMKNYEHMSIINKALGFKDYKDRDLQFYREKV